MPVDFYLHKPSPEHLVLVDKLASLIETETRVLSFPHHNTDSFLTNNSIVVSLGKVASNSIQSTIQDKGLVGVRHIELAHPSDLSRESGKKEAREQAFAALTCLNEDIKKNKFEPVIKKVTEEDLPELNAQQVLMLKSITDKGSVDGICFQTTKGGKLIEISKTKRDNSPAETHITFEELFMVRSIMELLQVKEVTLVSHNAIQ